MPSRARSQTPGPGHARSCRPPTQPAEHAHRSARCTALRCPTNLAHSTAVRETKIRRSTFPPPHHPLSRRDAVYFWSGVYTSYAFATKLRDAGRPLPKVHPIAKNRITQYMGSASAYAAALAAIQNDIQQLLRSNPEIFSFAAVRSGFVEIRDFQTTGVVAFAKRLPFSKLQAGKTSINGHRVQGKQEYLVNSIRAVETLVAYL